MVRGSYRGGSFPGLNQAVEGGKRPETGLGPPKTGSDGFPARKSGTVICERPKNVEMANFTVFGLRSWSEGHIEVIVSRSKPGLGKAKRVGNRSGTPENGFRRVPGPKKCTWDF